MNTYECIFHHCVRVERIGDAYIPYRYTRRDMDYFIRTKHPGDIRGCCASGITMDFITGAPVISFRAELISQMAYGLQACFDIYEDGVFTASVASDGFHRIEYVRRGTGRGRISVYLPVIYEMRFSDFDLGDWEEAPMPQKKLLVLGDSIAQGLFGARPSLAMVPEIARTLDMDYLNLSVGGEYHRGNIVCEAAASYRPDRIFVHLGTNDTHRMEDPDYSLDFIDEAYDAIERQFPGVRVDSATPVWRTEFDVQAPDPQYRLSKAIRVRDRIMSACARHGYRAHDCMKISPNCAALLADHCHPNDLGFQIYARRLVEAFAEAD